MKSVKFISSEIIPILEEEIDLFKQGKSNIERAKAVANLSHKFIASKRLEIQEEERIRRKLLKGYGGSVFVGSW